MKTKTALLIGGGALLVWYLMKNRAPAAVNANAIATTVPGGTLTPVTAPSICQLLSSIPNFGVCQAG